MSLPSIPSPMTWSAGTRVLAPRLRADVSDAVAFLLSRPYFVGQNQTGSSWASGSDFTLGLYSELSDPWNGHDWTGLVTGAVSSQMWCQAPGWYLARSEVAWAYTGAQAMFAAGFLWRNNGSTVAAVRGGLLLNGSTHPLAAQSADLIEQTIAGPIGGSGDYIQATAFQNTGSGVNLNNTSTLQPTVSVRWASAISGTEPLPVPPLATVPSPITSAWMNANVRDTINFLTYPPICKAVYAPGSSTLATATFPAGSVVPLNSVTVDNYGGMTTGASAAYTAPVAGRYYVYGQMNLAAAASSTGYGAGIRINGGTTTWGDVVFKTSDSSGGGATFNRRIRLNAGDTVQLMATQGSGSTIAYNTGSPNQTRFIIVWEGI